MGRTGCLLRVSGYPFYLLNSSLSRQTVTLIDSERFHARHRQGIRRQPLKISLHTDDTHTETELSIADRL
jgi:hypothetical protein